MQSGSGYKSLQIVFWELSFSTGGSINSRYHPIHYTVWKRQSISLVTGRHHYLHTPQDPTLINTPLLNRIRLLLSVGIRSDATISGIVVQVVRCSVYKMSVANRKFIVLLCSFFHSTFTSTRAVVFFFFLHSSPFNDPRCYLNSSFSLSSSHSQTPLLLLPTAWIPP
ncbi:hypothetical protein DFH08DRAFT_249463 [Mycena albidolilacea]|uniref:Uncharacterized protein n=1 Tax=Mycena albidolilacea TaxID=1033008 RepID=A0AAD7EN88_9AGAR|nr:hypothetical protein DFH08DRAFT_249463 [Mycena albidolilacea]